MLFQFKLYLIGVLYFFGALFMLLFPPRNFKQLTITSNEGVTRKVLVSDDFYKRSGATLYKERSADRNLKYERYVDDVGVIAAAEGLAKDEPDVVQLVRLPRASALNRSLVALALRSDKESEKPGILVIAALNGMTWASTNAVLELAEKLLYDTNYQTPFFNDYDWYLIPISNPDGLNFTQRLGHLQSLSADVWTSNVTARNNTRPDEWHKNLDTEEQNDLCFGTNINRNFAYHWQDYVNKAPNRCSQWYPGTKPFSTAEAQAIRMYIDKLGEKIHLAIHLHASFTPKKEYILYPWRYSLRQHSNHEILQHIGEYAATRSRLPDGRIYEVHQSSNDGRVAGSVTDYISGVVGTELVYLLKLYHQKYPQLNDVSAREFYVEQSIKTILSLVRGWRSSTSQNTLSFFGKDVEF